MASVLLPKLAWVELWFSYVVAFIEQGQYFVVGH